MIEYADPGKLNPVRHIAIISADSLLKETSDGLPASAIKFDLPATSIPGSAVRFGTDGEQILFRDRQNGIGILSRNGSGTPKVLMPFPAEYVGFKWSYDGKQMAFTKQSKSSEAIIITNKGL